MGENMPPNISIIIPVYNEIEDLENSVREIKKAIEAIDKNYEIIIAEQLSTDGTDRLADRLAKKDNKIRHIHFNRLGRGNALSKTIPQAKADIVMYMDVDLATDLRYLKDSINVIKRGADIATGSRMSRGSICRRPLKRELASRTYSYLVRIIFGIGLHDYQCGFKSFKKSTIVPLLGMVKNTYWSWDTEILIKAHRKGLRVVEFPIRWAEKGAGSKVKLVNDTKMMGGFLFELWWDLIFKRWFR